MENCIKKITLKNTGFSPIELCSGQALKSEVHKIINFPDEKQMTRDQMLEAAKMNVKMEAKNRNQKQQKFLK